MAEQTIYSTVEFSAKITGRSFKADYGVPGSPVWIETEPQDWADLTVDICGVTVNLSELPVALRAKLWDEAVGSIKDDKWEEYDE